MNDKHDWGAQCADRLSRVRKRLKFAQNEFAAKLGVANSYISELEAKKKNVTAKLVVKLAQTFNVNPNWLLMGSGSMFLDEKDSAGSSGVNLEALSNDPDVRIILEYFQLSPLVKHTVIGFALKFLHDNEDIIQKDIQVNRQNANNKGGSRS